MIHGPTALHVKNYLQEYFRSVELQPQLDENHYVFSLKTEAGEKRQLAVHRDNEAYCPLLPEYPRRYDFAGQLSRSNVNSERPLQQFPRVNIGSI